MISKYVTDYDENIKTRLAGSPIRMLSAVLNYDKEPRIVLAIFYVYQYWASDFVQNNPRCKEVQHYTGHGVTIFNTNAVAMLMCAIFGFSFTNKNETFTV